VYEDTKENAKYKNYADLNMPRKYGKGIYIQAANGGQLEGFVVIDSYPNMNPTERDEDEGDNSLALAARMHSKNLPRIKGYLASKKFAIFGVNQLRSIPLAMYGPKEQEPGGQALRFFSDVRFRLTTRALGPQPLWPKPGKKDKAHEYESSVTGEGQDKYRYVHIKTAKNKLGSWIDEGWLRLWVRDADRVAHGIDPVYDTLLYLKLTGQLSGKKREALQLKLEGWPKARDTNWLELKLWILGDKEAKIKISKKMKLEKASALRRLCFKQIEDGTAERLLAAAERSKANEQAEGDEE
jgi:hypothetical protein